MTMLIELTNGPQAIISDADANRVLAYRWYAKRQRSGHVYIYSTTGKTHHRLTLHRFILSASHGQQIDHINGNTFDNRRENLRFCTHSENMGNRQARLDRPIKGVTLHRCGKWQAMIAKRYIGLFDTAEQAARAYDAAAVLRYGEFARINFPKERVK